MLRMSKLTDYGTMVLAQLPAKDEGYGPELAKDEVAGDVGIDGGAFLIDRY